MAVTHDIGLDPSHLPNQLRVLCLQLPSLRTGGDYGPNGTLHLLLTLHRSERQTVACKSTHERNMLSQRGDAYVVCATDLAERDTGQDHHFLIFGRGQ